MIEPFQNLGHLMHLAPGWQDGAVDHQDRQPQFPRRRKLGRGPIAACVLADDDIHTVVLHHLPVAFDREGATRDDHRCVRQRQSADRRIDEAQDVMVLGLGGEFGQMHPAKRKENASGTPRKRLNGSGNVGNTLPVIAGNRLPGRAGQRDQRNAGLPRSGDCVGAHLCGERVRGINKMRDVVHAKIFDQPLHAAESPRSHRNRLRARTVHPAGITEDRSLSPLGQQLGECRGFGRAAEDQDVAHG